MKIEMTVQEAQEIIKGMIPGCMPVEMAEHMKEDARRKLGMAPEDMSEEVFTSRWSLMSDRFGYEIDEGLSTGGTELWNDYKSLIPFDQAKQEFSSFKARLINSVGVKKVRKGKTLVIFGVGKRTQEAEV